MYHRWCLGKRCCPDFCSASCLGRCLRMCIVRTPPFIFLIGWFYFIIFLLGMQLKEEWLQDSSRRQIKSFLIQQFFKNAGEVWASSPHLRSKSNCTKHHNKNLRENRKNRNCLQSVKVATWNKVSGAIAIPKASWGCAPALPNRIRVVSLRTSFIAIVPPEQLQDCCL